MATFRLGALAAADIISILARTEDRFGEGTRRRYEILLVTSLRDIGSDPERLGSAARPNLGPMVRSYHLRHSRERARAAGGFVRQPRHLLLYRAIVPSIIGVGRVLHDAMEVEKSSADGLWRRLTPVTAPVPTPPTAWRRPVRPGRQP